MNATCDPPTIKRPPAAAAAGSDPPGVRLVLTGERRNRCHIVRFDGTEVDLPPSLFDALVELVTARFATHTGFTRLPSSTISDEDARTSASRLRKRFDNALRHNVGKTLIETGLATEYRLTLQRSEIHVRPSFDELPPSGPIDHLRDVL